MPRRSNANSSGSSGALVGLLRLLPHLTLGELIDAEPAARHVTLGQLLGSAASRLGTSSAPTRHANGTARASGKRASSAGVDTRSSAGRSAYDSKVLAVIAAARGPVAAEAVIGKIGGEPLQFRAATKRLIKARKIKRTGKARGTRYEAT